MMAGSQHFFPCSLQFAGAAAGAAAGFAACARTTAAGTYAAANPTAAESVRPNIIFRCDIVPLLYIEGPHRTTAVAASRLRLTPNPPTCRSTDRITWGGS